MERSVDVPPAWRDFEPDADGGLVLVIGASDVGKTSFARYLFQRYCGEGKKVGFLDGDPGQSSLGPPTTMTLACCRAGEPDFPPSGETWRRFVGSVSPVGHMLPLLVGAERLYRRAQAAGVEVVVYDTTGFVDRQQGAHYLKLAKIDLLRPSIVVALQRRQELEELLIPLRRSGRVQVVDLPPSPSARRRDLSERQRRRADRFRGYFKAVGTMEVLWPSLAVLPRPRFDLQRLLALEDGEGFVRALAVVEQDDRPNHRLVLRTPLDSLEEVDALRVGDILLDPETFRDRRAPRMG